MDHVNKEELRIFLKQLMLDGKIRGKVSLRSIFPGDSGVAPFKQLIKKRKDDGWFIYYVDNSHEFVKISPPRMSQAFPCVKESRNETLNGEITYIPHYKNPNCRGEFWHLKYEGKEKKDIAYIISEDRDLVLLFQLQGAAPIIWAKKKVNFPLRF